MSLRRRIMDSMEILLRVPLIFVMDSVFANNIKLPKFYDTFNSVIININRAQNHLQDNYNNAVNNYNYSDNSHQTSSLFSYLNNNNNATTSCSDNDSIVSFNYPAIFLAFFHTIGKFKLSLF